MTRTISAKDLQLLAKLDIDAVEPANNISGGNDLLLIRGKNVGYWTATEKVVLLPEYFEIQRFGNFLKVGKADTRKNVVYYGAFCMARAGFVIPAQYPLVQFWQRFKEELLHVSDT